jgi:hypothetical protein
MNTTDISEEAKQALANVAQRKAGDRLLRDGCRTSAAMQRRVLALAAEMNLPPADCKADAQARHGQINRQLLQQAQCQPRLADVRRPERAAAHEQWADEKSRGTTVQEERSEIIRLLLALPPDKQKLAFKLIREMGGNASA